MKNKKKKLLLLLKLGITIALTIALVVLVMNLVVTLSVKGKIYAQGSIPQDTDKPYDCIIVLGCGVKADGTPSDMLYDRIKTACQLYLSGEADKILMSGDHGRVEYDEVNTMKRVASDEFGVPDEDIFMDHAGFSTYETMARASEIFGVSRAIVVTQEYHLSRALYLADSFGIDAVGVSASIRSYGGQAYRDAREVLARCKDIFSVITKPYYVGGEAIDIQGDGNVTNDQYT